MEMRKRASMKRASMKRASMKRASIKTMMRLMVARLGVRGSGCVTAVSRAISQTDCRLHEEPDTLPPLAFPSSPSSFIFSQDDGKK